MTCFMFAAKWAADGRGFLMEQVSKKYGPRFGQDFDMCGGGTTSKLQPLGGRLLSPDGLVSRP